jgi:hypothetical protein
VFVHPRSVRAFSIISHRFLAESGQLTEYAASDLYSMAE